MTFTVLLCTYNRCQSLATALASAAALCVRETDECEVLIVDNNSSDRTREVVEEFCGRYPGRFRYLFEPRQGKSHALNAGIRAAQGEIVAFMDDDVIVDEMWLHNLTAALDTEVWQGAGGRILPDQTFSPPRWLATEGRRAFAPFAFFDLGNDACELSEAPFGTNMAFRKTMFDKYGAFRTDLGPQPGSEIRGEDTEFGQRLLAAGERLRYEPSAVVYHPVPRCRLQKNYFLAWWFDKGRAEVRERGIPADVARFSGMPLYLFRRIAVWTLRWMVAVGPRERFDSKLKLWWNVGQFVECCHRLRDAKSNERILDSNATGS